MHKQVIVVRSDVKMSRGKTAAQSAHASVSALDKAGKAAAAEWKKEGQKKVVLKVSSLQEGIDLINACPFANTPSIFTSSGRAARQFQYEVHPSMIGVNIGVPAPMTVQLLLSYRYLFVLPIIKIPSINKPVNYC